MRRKKEDQPPVLKFRLTVGQRLSVLFGPLVGFGLGELIGWLIFGGLPPGEMLRGQLGVPVGWCLGLLIGRNFGTDLTPEFIDVHGLRERRIPWNRIVGIHIEKTALGRRVVIYEYDGRRTRLRAPINAFLSWDKHFEEKFHTIERQWAAARSLEPSDAIPVQ